MRNFRVLQPTFPKVNDSFFLRDCTCHDTVPTSHRNSINIIRVTSQPHRVEKWVCFNSKKAYRPFVLSFNFLPPFTFNPFAECSYGGDGLNFARLTRRQLAVPEKREAQKYKDSSDTDDDRGMISTQEASNHHRKSPNEYENEFQTSYVVDIGDWSTEGFCDETDFIPRPCRRSLFRFHSSASIPRQGS